MSYQPLQVDTTAPVRVVIVLIVWSWSSKTPEEAYQLLVDKILNFNEDICTAEGFISYFIKGKIPYKKSWI